jgi:hypothetical protein
MPRDLRKYASQTNLQLIIGALLVLFIVGGGLIYLIYGKAAALGGLLCLLMGMIPVALIVLILFFIYWIIKRANRD